MAWYETVNDLYEALRELVDEGHGDTPIRIAYQPSWPLAAEVENIRLFSDKDDDEPIEKVWIAASATVSRDENPYAPKDVWEEEW